MTGALKQLVEDALGALRTRDDEQDAALKALDERVTALESRTGAAPARKATTAKAGTASAAAKAGPAK
jgi:hypothetical protein